MPHAIAGSQTIAITDRRAIEERGPSQGQITTMDRGIMSAYSITSRKVKDTAADAENDAPHSGRPDDREIGRGSETICSAEFIEAFQVKLSGLHRNIEAPSE